MAHYTGAGDVTTIGLAIPSIPPRAELLARAVNSVCGQDRLPDRVVISIDHDHEGAAVTRNRAWRMLGDVDLIAFLDDDDELLPAHLGLLEECLREYNADMVYPWFVVGSGGGDPFPPRFATDPWDPANPHQTTVACLWRRDALERVGGFPEVRDDPVDPLGYRAGEEYQAVLALNEWGRIVHLPERTFIWHHHTHGGIGNTSGRPDRW